MSRSAPQLTDLRVSNVLLYLWTEIVEVSEVDLYSECAAVFSHHLLKIWSHEYVM